MVGALLHQNTFLHHCTCILRTLSLELSCYYWCWCSVFGDLITSADSLSTSLGMGLFIALKAGGRMLRGLWRAVAQ